jgi:predicted transcriptional regulator
VRANDKAGEIIRLRHAGFTIEEIAERTGRSRRTVFRLLQRAT